MRAKATAADKRQWCGETLGRCRRHSPPGSRPFSAMTDAVWQVSAGWPVRPAVSSGSRVWPFAPQAGWHKVECVLVQNLRVSLKGAQQEQGRWWQGCSLSGTVPLSASCLGLGS